MSGLDSTLNRFPAAKALVLWEDAKKTGVVVSSVTVAYYFMEHSGSTLIALLSKLLMFATIASYIFTHATKLLKWDAVRDKMLKIPELDEATARKIGDFIQKKANVTSRFGNQLLSGTDMMLSLKTCAALYVVGTIAGLIPMLTLVYVAFVLLFTVPKGYQLKKPEVDKLLATAEKHLGAYKDVVMDNVAKVIPAAKPAAGGASAAPPEPKTE